MECMRSHFKEGAVLNGRFETLSPLNHGSFGMVFLAKDLTNDELVAIKCLTKPSSSADCPSELAVDERSEELAFHARLGSHPNIVSMIDSFETGAHIFLVLEYCSMGDLYEAIRLERGPLETEHVRSFMLELVNAVEFMHSKGLYHRDIKPENIFLSQDGSMKLGDFGLATSETWSYESTVGSDRYMAPEQYDNSGNGYSPAKADIWAIGICLLNILFSRNPFVTPTESDPLFSDYIRDKQSLFDVFPNLSQDAFEVLSQSMAIDPEKRSLSAVRDALERVITFTTDDEILDDFCTEDRDVVPASANREPIRTPSIQSPQIDQGGSFPWAKALHMSPQHPVRQLSAIPDTESYQEDLFPGSEEVGNDWYLVPAASSSIASALDSGLGESLKSLAIRKPESLIPSCSEAKLTSGSMPINMTNKRIPAMASVFGKKEAVSKSWSDLWDEDEEEQAQHQQERILQERRAQNARSWSQESKEQIDEDRTLRREGLAELTNSSSVNIRSGSPRGGRVGTPGVSYDGISENDGFFFEDHHPPKPRYSPPSKRSIMDKWEALGVRRRAYTNEKDSSSEPKKRLPAGSWRRDLGLGLSGRHGDVWDRKDWSSTKDWRRDHHMHRDSNGESDAEWVGGWHDLHL
ncbi:MAG: hypothetical protein M1819_007121 [Sarea resinae]|nr:MAG: hypothetical protein M1819_007121 [Sarea resinae]